jgi:hypothetical protein
MNITINDSKPTLNLTWTAYFDDNEVVKQYNDDGSENKFKIVQDKFDKLVAFTLSHIHKPLQVQVDLRRGLIFINKANYISEELVNTKKKNVRLIYFRRNQVITDMKGEIIAHYLYYFIGYQYNDVKGKNRQVVLNIDQEGNIAIGDI